MPKEPVPVTAVWVHKNFPHLSGGRLDVYVETDGDWHHIQSHDRPDDGCISHITEIAGIRNAPVRDPALDHTADGWFKGPGVPQQINELGNFLIENFPNEVGAVGPGESAAQMAIRLLGNMRSVIDEQNRLYAQGSRMVNRRQVVNGLLRWGQDTASGD
jgi:hypothetical protein